MMRSWLRIVLVGPCAVAVAGTLLSTASATTAPKKPACAHKKAGTHKRQACAHKKGKPHKKAGQHKKPKPHKKGAVGIGDVNAATWMDDLAPEPRFRKLGDIVIPESHDSTTYSLPPREEF